MSIHYRSTRDLLSSLKELLAPNPRRNPEEVLQEAAEQIYEGRGYVWIGIYLAADDRFVLQCSCGPVSSDHGAVLNGGSVAAAGQPGKTQQPIRIGTRILGVIDAESNRPDGFSSQECALLEQVEELLARYLTTNRGKLLLRKARTKSQNPDAAEPHKRPQSARPGLTRAAAGDRSTR